MDKVKLTKRVVEGFEARDKTYTVRDAELPGFSLRVYSGGRHAFFFRYLIGGGRGAPIREPRIGDFGPLTVAARIVEHEGDLIVSLAIQAAADVVARVHYTIPLQCQIATAQWFKDVDPVSEWFEDGCIELHVKNAGLLLRELYLRFREDMGTLGIHHIPGESRFKQRLRERVDTDPQWEILRRNNGEMVFPRTLVSKVTNFS